MQYTKPAQLIFLIFLLIYLVFPASAWLSGFDYKKEHTVTYSGSSTLNNYQMRFVFYNTTGTDSGENCYLGSHINQTDWDDLRITTTTDGICDIWIQEKGTNYAIVWCEVPYIYSDQETRLFIYYGKSVATSVSDGDATFRVWGTFEQVPLNVEKWLFTGNYTQYTTDGITYLDVIRNATSGVSRVYSLDAFSYATGYELIGKINLNLSYITYFGFISSNRHALFYTDDTYPGMMYTSTKNVAAPTTVNLSTTYSGWRILQIQREPAGNEVWFLVNGTYVANHTSAIPVTTLPLEISSQEIGGVASADWVFVKKFVNPEPRHGVWDAEVVETAPNARFEATPQYGTPGTTVYFTDTSTGVVDSWAWDINNDGITDYTTKNCNYTYTSTGYYDVELDVTNTNGTSTETKTDYIYIYATATPTATPTDNMVELIDAGAIGITGTMVTVLIYSVLIVGMLGAIFAIFNR